ncbi:GlsB/YeaQ/YmgE family stress response membrane protein [Demetria terragena]|uniref:GlsB/YeaQ/YmgE family stress response membrane protein n=1 Tax=Demetria terragena TaxID=63959 RepID=UPI000362853C|nr:hypothetical protein [Demetria terragena]
MANILGAIVMGAVIGVLARLVLPGKQKIGFLATIGIGIVGALIGNFLSMAILNVGESDGINWIPLIISVAVAALGVSLYAGFVGKKSTSN